MKKSITLASLIIFNLALYTALAVGLYFNFRYAYGEWLTIGALAAAWAVVLWCRVTGNPELPAWRRPGR